MKSAYRNFVASSAMTLVIAAGVSTAPQPVFAGDELKKAIIGIGGALILNEINKGAKKKAPAKKRVASKPRAKKPAGPRVTIATFATTRDQVRDFQSRLNTLGFNAGTPDGLYGRNTRNAVSAFQASIGAAPTGRLSDSDAAILMQRSNQPVLSTGGTMAFAPNAGQPAPAFPSPAGLGGQPAPAFPTAGATQQPGVPTATFPTLGNTAQQPNAAAPSTTFPTIGNGTTMAATAPSPTFPQLGTPNVQGQSATATAPAFPAITTTTAAQQAPQATFPSTTAAAAATTVVAAAVATAAPQPSREPAEVQQFSILEVATGTEINAAKQKLAFEGLANCESSETITHCSSDGGAVNDLVALNGVAMTDGSEQIGAMSRHLTFSSPMQKEQLYSMMADTYGPLLQAPNHMVGTTDCMGLADLTTGGRAELTARTMSGDTASLATLAGTCSYFARIVFGPDAASPSVSELSIFVFDGSVFAKGSAGQPAKIKF